MATLVGSTRHDGPVGRIRTVWREAPQDLKRRLIGIYAILIGFNVAVWGALLLIGLEGRSVREIARTAEPSQ